MSVDQIMGADPRIDGILGTTRKVVAHNSKEFGKEIAKYIDSKDQRRGSDKGKKKDGANDKNKSSSSSSAPKAGGTLMDLVRKKANAQASVYSSGAKAGSDKKAGALVLAGANGNDNAGASGSGNNANNRDRNGEVNVEDLELWPLIRSVKVRCNSDALKTGTWRQL